MGISTPAVTIPTYAKIGGGFASYTAPAAPSNLTATVSGSTINLSWVSNSTNETGFQVERATALAGPYSTIATKIAGVTSHIDTSLSAGTYYYQVKALRNAQSSAYAQASGGAIVSNSFTPDVLFTFEQGPLNHGLTTSSAHIGVDNTLAAVRGSASVQSSYQNGYGASYSTTQTRGGRAFSASLKIRAGSDGDPSDNGDGLPLFLSGGADGLFGLNFGNLPAGVRGVSGSYTHVRFWIYIPTGINFTSNAGWLKMIRYHRGGSYGHVETHITNIGAHSTGIPNASQNIQEGWTFYNESDSSSQGGIWSPPINGLPTAFVTNRIFIPGQWNCLERRDDWNSNPLLAKRTLWLNGQFVAKFDGTNLSFINGSGVLQTYTGLTPSHTIDTGVIDEMRLFTYWNGYAPQNTELFVDSVIFHGGALPNVDEYGNPYLGLVNV